MEEKAPAAAHYGCDTNGRSSRGICRNCFSVAPRFNLKGSFASQAFSAKAQITPNSRFFILLEAEMEMCVCVQTHFGPR